MSVSIKTAEELEGKKIPSVVFHTHQGDAWVDVSTDDLFKGKRVVVFSLPAAFSPTCSAAHLPRYNELAKEFYDRGIDSIVCISVNDTFVMNAWLDTQKAENIIVMPDGNGEFTQAMGMLVNKEQAGLGNRSWRYSMIVNDGTIEKMFIEPSADSFGISGAETMLKYLDPNWESKQSVVIFTKPGCPYCVKAKTLLREKGFSYEEIVLGRDATTIAVRAITGKTSVPQIFIGGQYIGGSDDLEKHFSK